jgi:hypothetical protein
VDWLSQRVVSPNSEAEALKLAAYGHLLARKLEPPGSDRLRRLLDTAVARRKQRLVSDTAARLSSPTRTALDALVKTGAPESDTDQQPLFTVRSELAAVKDGAGAVKVETVLDEINKLKKLRALELPDNCSTTCPVNSSFTTGNVPRPSRRASCDGIRQTRVIPYLPRSVGNASARSPTPWWNC